MAEQLTPLYVVKALADVRESGKTNMLNRRAVAALVSSERASEWLNKASDSQFMAALNDMGDYISVPDGRDEKTLDEEEGKQSWF